MAMKISIGVAVALTLGVALWPASSGYPLLARGAICAVALAAALQAGRTDRNVWVFWLAAIAVMFNPIVPVVLPHPLVLWVTAASLMTFVASLFVLDRAVAPQTAAEVLHPSGVAK